NSRGVPNVDVWIPVDPGPHENVYWFDGRTHHGAPGTVTINRPGYICDLDRRAFSRREDFVDHLQRKHKVPPDHVADSLVTFDGQVHFRNECPPFTYDAVRSSFLSSQRRPNKEEELHGNDRGQAGGGPPVRQENPSRGRAL